MANVVKRRTRFKAPGYHKSPGSLSTEEKATTQARQAIAEGKPYWEFEESGVLYVPQDGQEAPVPWEVADPERIPHKQRKRRKS